MTAAADGPATITGAPEIAAAMAERRSDLVRFFALRCGSAGAGEALVSRLEIAVSEGRVEVSRADGLSSLFRFGSMMLAQERRDRRDSAQRGLARSRRGDRLASRGAVDERAAALGQLLGNLSPEVREVLLLNRFQGRPYAEIARILDLGVDDVGERMSEALAGLLRAANLESPP